MIKVNSEIGKLKKVLVHRPGKEVERLYPEIYERLLFDGIMFAEKAQEEHDIFTSKMREAGIEVFYIEELVAETIDSKPALKELFVDKYIELANIKNENVKKEIKEFLLSFDDNLELVKASIAGVKKTEISPKFENKLSDHVEKYKDYPFYIDPIPNILFQRDPIASIFDGINIHNMNRETRKREKLYYLFIFENNEKFKNLNIHLSPESQGTIEGGDILVINKETIFVGISERTTAKAVEELSEVLFKKYDHLKRVIGIEIPHEHATMHLDTVLTQVDRKLFSIDPDMYKKNYTYYEITRKGLKVFKNKEIIKLLQKYVDPEVELLLVGGGDMVRAKREQWNDGANCLAIAPGHIIVYERNVITNALLKEKGVKLIEIPSSELSLGRGGPRCMSMPLEREEI